MIFGKHINRYYLKHAPMLLLGIVALLFVDICQLKIPELYNYLINGMSRGEVEISKGNFVPFDMTFLLDSICRPMLIIILFMVVGRCLWRICFFGSGIKMETDLRSRMFDHCKDLSLQYYQVNKVGNLMSLFTNDLETVQDCFGSGILMLADAVLLCIMALSKMIRMDPMLTLLCLIPMALLLVISTVVGHELMNRWERRQEAFSQLSDFSQESFSGISVIKAFVKETAELMAFKKLNRHNEKANIAHTRASVLLRILVTFFVEAVICVILGYGGYLVYKGDFNAGDLLEFVGYFTSIVWPIMAISELIDMSSRGKASLKRIGELLDAEIDVKDAEGAVDIDGVKGDVEFKNLTFRYPGADYDALKNASFKINAGENVGIVGKTGSGKTTLVDLILRTYNVENGSLLIDGRDVNGITIKSLRKYCAYVPQDNFLFSDTIENNISFASDNKEHEKVENAAILSDVHSNIMDFSEKYETVLGERGVTVSGGQKQRISIARALMKEAPILILDDSVSAVDTKTEKVILENLRKTRAGKTTVLIAHRITTVEKMDKIIFIDDGCVVDVGTHTELCERCPDYKTMVDLQKLDEEKAD